MEVKRSLRVRMDGMSPWHFTCVFTCGLTFIAIAMLIGWKGPEILLTKAAGASGTEVVLYDANTVCNVGPSGALVPETKRCWNHYFVFNSRWTQYFDVQMQPNRFTSYADLPAVNDMPVPFTIQWAGLKAGQAPTVASNWQTIYNGNVTRHLWCAAGTAGCSGITLFRSNSVQYERYFVQISFPPGYDTSQVQQLPPALASVTFTIRYKSADFAMFEVGFKTTYMVISLIVLVVFTVYTGCDWGCGMYCFCIARGSSLNFQRQAGVNWMYFMLLFLFIFNEPLLWMKYYAVEDAGVLSYFSVGGQLTFVCLLHAFWLVEFGLLKANANRAYKVNPCAFYCPKLTAIFVFWLMAVAVYGWILVKQQEDPMFDWIEYAYSTAVGGQGPNARIFLITWLALGAGLYLLYMAWLIFRSLTVICSFKQGEKYLFSLHFLVLFATALGLAGGTVLGVDVTTALDFMFFNALFNAYIYVLAYMYTPIFYTELDAAAGTVNGNTSGPDGNIAAIAGAYANGGQAAAGAAGSVVDGGSGTGAGYPKSHGGDNTSGDDADGEGGDRADGGAAAGEAGDVTVINVAAERRGSNDTSSGSSGAVVSSSKYTSKSLPAIVNAPQQVQPLPPQQQQSKRGMFGFGRGKGAAAPPSAPATNAAAAAVFAGAAGGFDAGQEAQPAPDQFPHDDDGQNGDGHGKKHAADSGRHADSADAAQEVNVALEQRSEQQHDGWDAAAAAGAAAFPPSPVTAAPPAPAAAVPVPAAPAAQRLDPRLASILASPPKKEAKNSANSAPASSQAPPSMASSQSEPAQADATPFDAEEQQISVVSHAPQVAAQQAVAAAGGDEFGWPAASASSSASTVPAAAPAPAAPQLPVKPQVIVLQSTPRNEAPAQQGSVAAASTPAAANPFEGFEEFGFGSQPAGAGEPAKSAAAAGKPAAANAFEGFDSDFAEWK